MEERDYKGFTEISFEDKDVIVDNRSRRDKINDNFIFLEFEKKKRKFEQMDKEYNILSDIYQAFSDAKRYCHLQRISLLDYCDYDSFYYFLRR